MSLKGSRRVIVVGGGPAGLMAAGRAASSGVPALLIERTSRLGNKLRLAGGGKPDLGHHCQMQEFLNHVNPDGRLLYSAMARFDVRWLRQFFADIDLPLNETDDGRLVPAQGGGHDVAKALRRFSLEQGVTFRYDTRVMSILVENDHVAAVRYEDGEIDARAVVLATGGCSYPETGSSGDGYDLARQLGHSIAPLYPGLVGLHIGSVACRVCRCGI